MNRLTNAFRNRTFPVLTLILLLAITLVYFLFYVRGRESYFTHRYLRLLAFESERIEERLLTLEGIFANYQKDQTLTAKDLPEDLPGLERLDQLPPGFQDLPEQGVALEGRIEEGRFRVYAGWKQRASVGGGENRNVDQSNEETIDVAYRFDPIRLAQPSLPDDFESLFVARRDGTVLYQISRDGGQELRIVNVRRLLTEDGKELDLATFTSSTSRLDVQFAGEPYKLFLRPCCRAIWETPREPSPRGDGQRVELVLRTAPSGVTAERTSSPPPQAEARSAGGERSLEWVVGGLVRSSTLSRQCWAISFTVGIVLISLFLLALLSVPFLRVLSIGPEEKLRVSDALWTGSTALVGVGLLTLLLLDLHAYRALVKKADENLATLAGEIAGNMGSELEKGWGQLGRFNDFVIKPIKGDPQARSCEDVIDLLSSQAYPPLVFPRGEFLWKSFSSLEYTDFERFTLVDRHGRQCFKWSLGKATDPLVLDVSDRSYFREALKGQNAVEPVFSWATGNRVTVLAQPVGSSAPGFVGVLGIEMSSLNWPVLPPGYGFAVVDESGNVLFHSVAGRAGYENFFEEADGDRALRALVYARRTADLNAAYMGRGHRLRVQPISLSKLKNPPFWSLIVFSDKRELRAFNVDVLTTAMLLLILYFLVYLMGSWFLRFAKRSYRAGWLWPEKKGEPRAGIHLRLTAFYLVCLVISMLAVYQLDGIDLLWFASAFPWALLLVSYCLSVEKRQRGPLGAALAFVLLLIYLAPGSGTPQQIASLLGQDEYTQSVWVLIEARGHGFFLALTSLMMWGCFFAPWISYRIHHSDLVKRARSFSPRIPHKLRLALAAPEKWARSFATWMQPRRSYLTAASCLLILTAAFPAAAFFCAAHRAHLETRVKRGQLELALGRERRNERIDQLYHAFEHQSTGPKDLLEKRKSNLEWDLYNRFFFGTRFEAPRPEDPESPGSEPSAQVAQVAKAALVSTDKPLEQGALLLPMFLDKVLPLYAEDLIRVRRLSEDVDRGGDAAWRWYRDKKGASLTLRRGDAQLISSLLPLSLSGFPLLWPLSLLLLFGAIYGLACFMARKFFLFGVPTPEVAIEPLSVASASAQSFILVSASIAAPEGRAIIDLRDIASRKDLLARLEGADLVTNSRIYLHHFEYRLQDEEHNLLKLELVEELILGRDKPVVIFSHVVPAWYLLDRKTIVAVEEDAVDPDKAAKRQDMAEKVRKEVQERWRQLLRRFVIWDCSHRADAAGFESRLRQIVAERALPSGTERSWKQAQRQERLLSLVREECGESEQLQGLAESLFKSHLQDLSRDLLLEDLRERAEPYYRTLWAMCTDEEKLVLVHLAEGGLVNPRNTRALTLLMRRGLVKRNPFFQVMNESFRRFIAGGFCMDEVRSLERKAEASAWGRIKGPLTAALVGVAAFFFITQRELFDISMAFLSTVAASLPALFRVFGTATPSQSKPAS